MMTSAIDSETLEMTLDAIREFVSDALPDERLLDLDEKDEFPVKDFEKYPEKYTERLLAIFKKVEAEKSGDEQYKTFADRMKADLLPGGNVQGKQDD